VEVLEGGGLVVWSFGGDGVISEESFGFFWGFSLG